MKDPVITDLLKYLLLVQHPPVVLEVGDVSSLPPFSRCPLDLDVVPSSCVPISAHLEVQRSTPTPSFNLEPDGGNLVEKKASGTCFFSVHQTAPSKEDSTSNGSSREDWSDHGGDAQREAGP